MVSPAVHEVQGDRLVKNEVKICLMKGIRVLKGVSMSLVVVSWSCLVDS